MYVAPPTGAPVGVEASRDGCGGVGASQKRAAHVVRAPQAPCPGFWPMPSHV